jgi:c-di-GMP-binding flagellar brake protein YcgR
MPWVLLQYYRPFLPAANNRNTATSLVIAGAVVLLLIVGGVIVSRRRRYLGPEARRKYSRQVFYKMARNLGLSKIHIDYLEYLVRVCKVQQPFLVFSNPGLLDDLLRKGIYSLQQNAALKAEDRERRMAHLFQIKQIIERNAKRAVGISSTSFLRIGQGLTITPEGGPQYQCRVMSNLRELLAVSAPLSESGIPVRWSRGTKVRLSFWREGDAGYSFESKVVAHDTIKGVPCILIPHSRSLRRAQQRKYRRSTLNRPCFFYPVHIMEQQEGRSAERRAMVQTNRRLLGHLLDISAGGCSVSSLAPLPAGSLCKLEFEIRRPNRIVVFGKVKRTRGLKSQHGGVMHVMFTTLSSQHLNQIYTFVYGYSPPGTPRPQPAR